MTYSVKYLTNKLDTYGTLLSVSESNETLLEIRELKYNLYSYLLEIASGKDVDFCQMKVDGILKRLRFLGCGAFVDKFESRD